MTGGLHAGRPVHPGGASLHGQDRAGAQHRAARGATKLKQTVAVFSLEMSKESLLTRMLCAAARVDSQKFRAGYLTQDERRKLNHALHELVEAPLYIDDTAGLHLMDMHAKLRRLQSGARQTRPGDRGLPAVDERPRALREPQPGSQRAFARHEAAGQGAERPDDGALAVEPRGGNPAGRSPAAAQRPARIGIHRAGRRRGGLHLPRGSLQPRPRRPARAWPS